MLWPLAVAAALAAAAAAAGAGGQAASSRSLAADQLSVAQTAGPVARRYCSCHDKARRHTRTYQTCIIRKDSLGGLLCKSETLPFAQRWHNYTHGLRGIHMLYLNGMQYFDAETICSEENATLAVPKNKRGYDDLYATVRKHKRLTAWVGINDRKVEGTYVDPDGLKPPYLHWKDPEHPDNLHDEDCLVVEDQNGYDDRSCYHWNYAFICERRMTKTIPSGYVFHWANQIFYKLYQEQMTHAAARRRCQDDGGSLVAFETWADVETARTHIADINRQLWVDFTDQEAEGHFVSSTGKLLEDMDFINWAPYEPNNGGRKGPAQNCLSIMRGQYSDKNCDTQQQFMCEIKIY